MELAAAQTDHRVVDPAVAEQAGRPAMVVEHLWLTDFRSWPAAELVPAGGLTVLTGPNGAGKTNLLEAVAFLGTRRSFRAAPTAALIRTGADQAVVRAEGSRGTRRVLLEAEIKASGRDRFLLNRQPVRGRRGLADAIVTSVFTPDDLELVKGGPAARRGWLDDVLAAASPAGARLVDDTERILRQRGGLLRQVAPIAPARLAGAEADTLAVWDEQLAAAGDALGRARADLLDRLRPALADAHVALAGSGSPLEVRYDPSWLSAGLGAALAEARAHELRRGHNLVGPHRDDVHLEVDGRPARTHASQGEQRTVALALRLAAHRHLAQVLGATPVLLLDDVFSELDEQRAAALVEHLPAGQALLTTTSGAPRGTRPDLVVGVEEGGLVPS